MAGLEQALAEALQGPGCAGRRDRGEGGGLQASKLKLREMAAVEAGGSHARR